MFSLLDGFSRYNQVLVALEDRLKTTFRTKWGTYAYMKMPFGLINARATFESAMDISFRGILSNSVMVYLDDVTMFSKERPEHIIHLKQILNRCRKYGISLNPKKSIFCVTKGNLFSLVVSKERSKVIAKILTPHNKKSMQSFMGKIDFIRRFILNFVETVKHLQDMINKKVEYKWEANQGEAFMNMREAISNSPSLVNPEFLKEFFLYTFATDISYVVILTQKNQDGDEVSISFMSAGLDEAQLKYQEVDKQAYVVFKVVKHFSLTC